MMFENYTDPPIQHSFDAWVGTGCSKVRDRIRYLRYLQTDVETIAAVVINFVSFADSGKDSLARDKNRRPHMPENLPF